jgi:hypothetical protein
MGAGGATPTWRLGRLPDPARAATDALPTLGAAKTAPADMSTASAHKLEYWHPDQLGSLATTVDHNDAVSARRECNPCGKRRQTTGACVTGAQVAHRHSAPHADRRVLALQGSRVVSLPRPMNGASRLVVTPGRRSCY